jgi:choline kinase
MQVVLLAAGQATRLRPLTDDRPKCLLEVAGRSILSRCVGQLSERGLRQITVVDGYRGDMIRRALSAEFPGVDFRFFRNDRYATTNNAWSLMLAECSPDEPLLLLDSDIVFDDEVLDRVLAHPEPSRLALRTEGEIGEEEMKVCIGPGGRVVDLGKGLAPAEAAGESVGIEVFSAEFVAALGPVLRRRLLEEQRVNEYYEDAFLEMIRAGWPVATVDIAGLSCLEIDTAADLAAAQLTFAGR